MRTEPRVPSATLPWPKSQDCALSKVRARARCIHAHDSRTPGDPRPTARVRRPNAHTSHLVWCYVRAVTDLPLYKAALAKSLLEEVEKMAPGERDAVLDHVGSEHLLAINDAIRTDWINARHQLAIDEAIEAHLGPNALVNMVRKYAAAAGDVPIFRPIKRGAIALFGVSPHGFFKMVPRAWSTSSRNCGYSKYTKISDHEAELAYRDLPGLMRTSCFATSTRGGVYGVLDIAEAKGGDVESDTSLLAEGVVTHRATWTL